MADLNPQSQRPARVASPTSISRMSNQTPEMRYHPPFPPAAVSPVGPDAEQAPPVPHPHIEEALNATAAHMVPGNPIAQKGVEKHEVPGPRKDVTREGMGRQDELPQLHAEEERDDKDPLQRPIVRGTPLDELKTPMLERGPASYRATGKKNGSDETVQAMSRSRGKGDDAQAPPDPFARTPSEEEEDRTPDAAAGATRPGFGAGKEMGSVRMGASALISALNAIPWEEDHEGSSDSGDGSDDEDEYHHQHHMSASEQTTRRPKMDRLGSSLHTIRPMTTPANDAGQIDPRAASYFPEGQQSQQAATPGQPLTYPFRQNVIARKAKSPNPTELEYQLGTQAPQPTVASPQDISPVAEEPAGGSRRISDGSDGGLPLGGAPRKMMEQRVAAEEEMAAREEAGEIEKAATETPSGETGDAPYALASPLTKGKTRSEDNVAAALREGTGDDAIMEDTMEENPQEKKRVRREKLAERLQEVFGLEEREEVREEMRCWLLRSVMLKGYMYLTAKHICFFAHMPNRENLIVKTGPLSKKASRTKMFTKFWAVLKNDVLSWYESTNDPYFPKGNISLQYASSCDAIDDNRFKIRMPHRNYTFTADTPSARDEWIKTIEKVMFKTQHEGECIKLIIPLEAVLEVEKSPTLEFAECLEIKCVDPDDQMAVDSYFFASFQDGDKAIQSIQKVLDERPSSELPRPNSPHADGDDEENEHKHSSGPLSGLKKIGAVFKPLVGKSSDKDKHKADDSKDSSDAAEEHKSGFSIPFMKPKPSHDSLETLRTERDQGPEEENQEQEYEGYPPRQAGAPPPGMDQQDKPGWQGWIKRSGSKIVGTSPNQQPSGLYRSPSGASTLTGNVPPGAPQLKDDNTHRDKHGKGKRESVTEIVEPVVPEDSDSEDEIARARGGRITSDSQSSLTGGPNQSEYSLMERSESHMREDEETANKFHSVFALSEKEELIDHFPGYLYRVLPVSGRFFISTNFFCFRSSQLLYKTKMIIPIRDLYGLKAQKAFRPGHSGLIIVIKGHEELFLEFSSDERRTNCVSLLEARMEAVRNNSDDLEPLEENMATRVMEDLNEHSPVDLRKQEAGEPSMMFGSTTSTFLEFKPDPMKITCLTIGSRGDVQPYIALCKGLQAEGHHTRIASHGEYKEWVEGHGIEFASVGGDPAELMQMCVDNGMFTVSFLKEGVNKFRGWLDDLLESSWKACQGSDLLIESPSAMGGIHIAEALRIPYYRAFTMPWTRTRAYPHAFAVPEHKRGGAYNYMTYTMFDQVFWRAIAGQINRWRKKSLHIEPTDFDKLKQHKVPFLYNFSPNIVPPPLDWTEWIHVTGYWFLENSDESAEKEKDYEPPEGLVEFIDKAHKDGKKVVYIGFGSIVVSDPQEMTRCVVDAVVDSGVCAILSKGWSDRGKKDDDDDKSDDGDKDDKKDEKDKDEKEKEKKEKKEKEEKEEKEKEDGDNDDKEDDKEGADGIKYPDSIFPIDSVDHSWLFPRIDAACHHGGAGTTGASLRAGIPTIIKPFFGDQAFWSERVESMNVGSAVRKLTKENLAEALKQATNDEKQVNKARVIGEMIRKENGVARAIEAIYRDLEYAKSLIKPLHHHDEHEHNTLEHIRSHPSSIIPFRSHSRDRSPSPTRTGDSTRNPSRVRSDFSSEHDHVSDSSWDVLSDHENGGGKGDGVPFSPTKKGRVGDVAEEDPEKGHGRERSGSTASSIMKKIKSVV